MRKSLGSRALPLLLLAAVAVALLWFGWARGPDTTSAIDGAALRFPSSDCSGSTATVTFAWTPVAGATAQYLDLTLFDNGFADGTFVGAGPLAGTANSLAWGGITKGLPHIWRVNALTPAGWVTSATGAFVPCGGPALLWGPLTCTSANDATLNFRWAALSPPGSMQYLDLGFDPSFAPGSYVGVGPLPSDLGAYEWRGIQANAWTYFRLNTLTADGQWHSSQTGAFYGECAPSVNPDLYGSSDRLVIPRVGINAPVNVRDVGPDGAMGNPAGPTDVVRYNFPLAPGLGGYPGNGGNTSLAGHVDYRGYGPAVFWNLRNVAEGDIIEYWRGDGGLVRYQVQWISDLSPDGDWAQYVAATNPESITLITCNGEFDAATRSYNARRVVRGVRVP